MRLYGVVDRWVPRHVLTHLMNLYRPAAPASPTTPPVSRTFSVLALPERAEELTLSDNIDRPTAQVQQEEGPWPLRRPPRQIGSSKTAGAVGTARPSSRLSRLRASAPAKLVKSAVKRAADAVCELRLGVRTAGSSLAGHVPGGIHRDSVWYEPTSYVILNRFLKALDLRPDDVVFDIGCGLGRVLCVLARRPLKKVVGIDLSEELVSAARRNVAAMRGRRTPVEILCVDASQADYTEGSVFYLYNSFGPATLQAVLHRIRASVESRPRRVRILYVNPVQNHVLEAANWLRRLPDARSPWYEMHATVWEYDPAARPV